MRGPPGREPPEQHGAVERRSLPRRWRPGAWGVAGTERGRGEVENRLFAIHCVHSTTAYHGAVLLQWRGLAAAERDAGLRSAAALRRILARADAHGAKCAAGLRRRAAATERHAERRRRERRGVGKGADPRVWASTSHRVSSAQSSGRQSPVATHTARTAGSPPTHTEPLSASRPHPQSMEGRRSARPPSPSQRRQRESSCHPPNPARTGFPCSQPPPALRVSPDSL